MWSEGSKRLMLLRVPGPLFLLQIVLPLLILVLLHLLLDTLLHVIATTSPLPLITLSPIQLLQCVGRGVWLVVWWLVGVFFWLLLLSLRVLRILLVLLLFALSLLLPHLLLLLLLIIGHVHVMGMKLWQREAILHCSFVSESSVLGDEPLFFISVFLSGSL